MKLIERDTDRASGKGEQMMRLVAELYPICRSITGNGVRETLKKVQQYVPLEIHEIPSGTKVFDWSIPKEWNIRDAYVKNARGEKLIDFKRCNLHVLNYSTPISARMTLAELKPHLFTLPDQKDLIPYRTSYYRENWGFCLTHEQYLQLREDEEYDVLIDSSLEDGSLTYGEYFVKGTCADEVLISCHICHPSLCNDNLSGISLVTYLAFELSRISLKHSYRFLMIPGTIGAITWLALNQTCAFRIKHGLVVSGVGDAGPFTYKRSRRGNALIDQAVEHILRWSCDGSQVKDFSPYGYDERQFCSPGFDLAVGSLTRSPYGSYPEYHTSADNLDFVRAECLEESLSIYLQVIDVLENNASYLSTNPMCEPQLGRRGLYQAIGGIPESERQQLAMLWVLNLSDGRHSLLDIAERANLPFSTIHRIARILVEHDLLKLCPSITDPQT